MFDAFIEQYNRPLKEGLYSDYSNRDALLELVRFKSSTEDGWVSLDSYKERMKSDQKSIYYITGGKEEVLKASPLLGAYTKRGYEVLIMSDDIDDIVISQLGFYKELPLKAINKSGAVDDLKEGDEKTKESKESKALIKKIKKALGNKVKDVVASTRLVDAPAVVVVDENDPTVQMQQLLKMMGQDQGEEILPILEINLDDPIIRKIETSDDKEYIEDLSSVLLDQALLSEGVMPKDPVAFTRRLQSLLAR